jgi:hypothetical protein
MVDIQKGFMLLVWRFQQVNSMIIIIGLSMTLTLQLYPYVGWRFYSIGLTSEHDWLIMLIMFSTIFAAAVVFGIIYDVILKLWIPQSVVTIERQPYAKEKFAAKSILNRQYFFIPMLRKVGLEQEAEFNSKWIERNLDEDPNTRKDVDRIVQWINEYKLKPADQRWLKDLEEIMNKPYSPKSKSAIKKMR